MTTKEMIEKIRDAIGACTASEKECMEALVEEAEGWRMRLEELEAEEPD